MTQKRNGAKRLHKVDSRGAKTELDSNDQSTKRCIVRLCRVKSAPFFSVAEKRSPPPAFKNNEYEVGGAAGTMDRDFRLWV